MHITGRVGRTGLGFYVKIQHAVHNVAIAMLGLCFISVGYAENEILNIASEIGYDALIGQFSCYFLWSFPRFTYFHRNQNENIF